MAVNMNDVCKAITEDVSDGLACGVVDLNTGMLLGVHNTVAYFTQAYLDAVAAAAVDMFRGKTVSRVEQLIAKQRGVEPERAFHEIQVTTPNTYHFMKIVDGTDALLVLITKKSTNLGMGWSVVRMSVDDVQAALG